MGPQSLLEPFKALKGPVRALRALFVDSILGQALLKLFRLSLAAESARKFSKVQQAASPRALD